MTTVYNPPNLHVTVYSTKLKCFARQFKMNKCEQASLGGEGFPLSKSATSEVGTFWEALLLFPHQQWFLCASISAEDQWFNACIVARSGDLGISSRTS